jgi:hypothetical protein
LNKTDALGVVEQFIFRWFFFENLDYSSSGFHQGYWAQVYFKATENATLNIKVAFERFRKLI